MSWMTSDTSETVGSTNISSVASEVALRLKDRISSNLFGFHAFVDGVGQLDVNSTETEFSTSPVHVIHHHLRAFQLSLFPSIQDFAICPQNETEMLYDVLSLCLLLPSTSSIPEDTLPGITSVIVPLRFFSSPIEPDGSDLSALLFILCVRLGRHPVLACELQVFTSHNRNIQSIIKCLSRWLQQFVSAIDNASEVFPNSGQSHSALQLGCHIAFLLQALTMSISQSFSLDNYLQQDLLRVLENLFFHLDRASERDVTLVQIKCLINWLRLFGICCQTAAIRSSSRESEYVARFKGVDGLIQQLLVEKFSLSDAIVNPSAEELIKQSILLSELDVRSPSNQTIQLVRSLSIPSLNSNCLKDFNIWYHCNTSDNHISLLTMTCTAQQLLQQLLIYAIEGTPCLLCGPTGSGKSFYLKMLYYFYHKTNGETPLWLYVDNSVDAKCLLGSWQSGKKPKEFVWSDGVLTKAVKSGRWIIFENVDKSSEEVQLKLQELVTGDHLYIPDRGIAVQKNPRFRLFGTICVPSMYQKDNLPSLGYHRPKSLNQWRSLELYPFSRDDIIKISTNLYLCSSEISSQIYAAFHSAATSNLLTSVVGEYRQIGVRDFFKLCQRISKMRFLQSETIKSSLVEATRMEFVQEFFLTVAFSIPDPQVRIQLTELFGLELELSTVQTRQKLTEKPNVVLKENSVSVGRITQNRNVDSNDPITSSIELFEYTAVHARVMEGVLSCLSNREPVLLVGDTGTGKTTLIQHIAKLLNYQAVIYNFSDQSESTDLIGRIVPEDASSLIQQLKREFVKLLSMSEFLELCHRNNTIDRLSRRISLSDWLGCLQFFHLVSNRLIKVCKRSGNILMMNHWTEFYERCINSSKNPLLQKGDNNESSKSCIKMIFRFEEGLLLKALREGQWLILDEINLAPSDVLQRLSGLLDPSSNEKFVVTENDGEEIMPHPNFRIFGCMNPSLQPSPIKKASGYELAKDYYSVKFNRTETGKKELPYGIRQCFTEFYVDEVDAFFDLQQIIEKYLPHSINIPTTTVTQIYLAIRQLTKDHLISTGAGKIPHFSLRTIVRATKFAAVVGTRNFRPKSPLDSIADGLIVNFATCLAPSSFVTLISLIQSKLKWTPPVSKTKLTTPKTNHHNAKLRFDSCGPKKLCLPDQFASIEFFVPDANKRFKPLQIESVYQLSARSTSVEAHRHSVVRLPLNQALNSQLSSTPTRLVEIEGYLIQCGPEIIDIGEAHQRFVVTKTVRQYLASLSRVLSGGRVPVLLEGPTSAGKSSLVKFLCQLTGHHFVRINNHEHTDLQEYLGQHVTDPTTGQLVFAEGAIAQAARYGHWVVLDELNLASSEVLEALNRLLDDNRELFIPETGEVIKAHPDFMIFATQNPASGPYGGRKILSKAFRNRFIEMFVDEIPATELEEILRIQCQLAPSHIKSMLEVYRELKSKRSKSSVFESSSSFMTIRDLLKWGHRRRQSKQESRELLALDGYYLIAERLRDETEKIEIKKLLEEKCLKKGNQITIDFGNDAVVKNIERQLVEAQLVSDLCLTAPMARLVGLVQRCIENNEPVLLVGETGAGKTTLCQVLAKLSQTELKIINCHQHTETADLLGSMRPVKDRSVVYEECIKTGMQLIQRMTDRDLMLIATLTENDKTKQLVVNCSTIIEEAVRMMKISLGKVQNDGSKNSSLDMTTLKLSCEALKEHLKNSLRSFDSGIAITESSSEVNTAEKIIKRRRIDLPHSNGRTVVDEEFKETNECPSCDDTEFNVQVTSTISLINSFLHQYQSATKLFQWTDGPLVHCMKHGYHLLLDEISLAEDGVLERLNSVLEPERLLVLAEKGGAPISSSAAFESSFHTSIESIYGHSNFRILATMNPGGDFGKRELSPALRNRFTEIWVPAVKFHMKDNNKYSDSYQLIYRKLSYELSYCVNSEILEAIALCIHRSISWFNRFMKHPLTIREVLAWVTFIKSFMVNDEEMSHDLVEKDGLRIILAFIHGGCMVLIDPLGLGNDIDTMALMEVSSNFVTTVINYLIEEVSKSLMNIVNIEPLMIDRSVRFHFMSNGFHWIHSSLASQIISSQGIRLGPFKVPSLHTSNPSDAIKTFSFTAPTTAKNLGRILRALQLNRSILLEGPPGAGKTAIIQALANITGNTLVRINLSEQTDLMDLIGSDLPSAQRTSLWSSENQITSIDSGYGQEMFRWYDGVLLRAMKSGHWVILDELNLASQQVLEGLNALLDHRREIYIPELDKTVHCGSTFRLFAAQNPTGGGGGRKGLPRSFLNRFSRIVVDQLTTEDFRYILENEFNSMDTNLQKQLIQLIGEIKNKGEIHTYYGNCVWEWNLRDLLKLGFLVTNQLPSYDPRTSASLLLASRLRNENDIQSVNLSIQHHLPPISASDITEELPFGLEYLISEIEQIYTETLGSSSRASELLQMKQILNIYRNGNTSNDRISESTGFLNSHLSVDSSNGDIMIGDNSLSKGLSRNRISVLSSNVLNLFSQQDVVMRVNHSIQLGWPIMLTGPSSSGKTSIIRYLANLSDCCLSEITLTDTVDATELLGTFEPEELSTLMELLKKHVIIIRNKLSTLLMCINNGATVQECFNKGLNLNLESQATMDNIDRISKWLSSLDTLLTTLLSNEILINDVINEIQMQLKASTRLTLLITSFLTYRQSSKNDTATTAMTFRWMDGQLLQSIERGNWILLRHVHYASAAVLDRLNSLLEPNGFILLTECGESQVIRPHSNFRIFFTSESTNDADVRISKALRNRCLEIYVGQNSSMMIPTQHQNLEYLKSIPCQIIVPSSSSLSPLSSLPCINPLNVSLELILSSFDSINYPLLTTFEQISYKALHLMLLIMINYPFYFRNVTSPFRTLLDSFLLTRNRSSDADTCLLLSLMRMTFEIFFSSLLHFSSIHQLECLTEFVQQQQSGRSPDQLYIIRLINGLKELIESTDCARAPNQLDQEYNFSVKSALCRCSAFIKCKLLNSSLTTINLLLQWLSAEHVAQSIVINHSDRKHESWEEMLFDASYCSVLLNGEDVEIKNLLAKILRSTFACLRKKKSGHPLWNQLKSLIIHLCGNQQSSLSICSIKLLSTSNDVIINSTVSLRIILMEANRAMKHHDDHQRCRLRWKYWKDISHIMQFLFERLNTESWNSMLDIIKTLNIRYPVEDERIQKQFKDSIEGLDRLRTSLYHQLECQLQRILNQPTSSLQSSSLSWLHQAEAIISNRTGLSVSQEQLHLLTSIKSIMKESLILAIRYPILFQSKGKRTNTVVTVLTTSTLSTTSEIIHLSGSLSLLDCMVFKSGESSEYYHQCGTQAFHFDLPTELMNEIWPNVMITTDVMLQSDLNLSNLNRVMTQLACVHQWMRLLDQSCLLCSYDEKIQHGANFSDHQYLKQNTSNAEILSFLIESEWINIRSKIKSFSSRLKRTSVENTLKKHCHVPFPDLLSLRPPYISAVEILLEYSFISIYKVGLQRDLKQLDSVVIQWYQYHQLFESADVVATLRCLNAIKKSKGQQESHKLVEELWNRLGVRCIKILETLNSMPNMEHDTKAVAQEIEIMFNFTSFDFLIIAHLAHVIVLVGGRLLSISTISEFTRLKIFLSGHLNVLLQHVSRVCLQIVGPTIITVMSAMTSGLWIVETSPDLETLVAHSVGNELVLSGRMLITSMHNLSNVVRMKGEDQEGDILSKLLLIDENVVAALRSGLTTIGPLNKYHSQATTAPNVSEIAFIDVERYVGWRSGTALSLCKQMASTLTLGEVLQAKHSIILLQQLYNGWKDVDAVIFNLPNSEKNNLIHFGQKWDFLCQWIDALFETLKCNDLRDVTLCTGDVMRNMKDSINAVLGNEPINQQEWNAKLSEFANLLRNDIILLSRTVSPLSRENSDLLDQCISQYGLLVCNTLSQFVEWLKIQSARSNERLAVTLADIEHIWAMFITIAGCWRLHSGSSLLTGSAKIDVSLAVVKEEAEEQANEIEHETKIRTIDSSLVYGSFDHVPATVDRLEKDAKAFRHVAGKIAEQLPLRSPLKLKDDKLTLITLLSELKIIRPQDESLQLQFEKMVQEIDRFISTFWNLERLQGAFPFLNSCTATIDASAISAFPYFSHSHSPTNSHLAITQLSWLFVSTTNFLEHLQQYVPLFPDIFQPLALTFHVIFEGFLSLVVPWVPSSGSTRSKTQSLLLLGHPSTIKSYNANEAGGSCCQSLTTSSLIDRYLWKCEWFNRTLEIGNLQVKSHMKPFKDVLTQLCELLDHDNRKRREIEAQQFITYIQDQKKQGPDQEESIEDLSKKIFPQGNFVDETTWDDYNMALEATKSSISIDTFHLLKDGIGSKMTSSGEPELKKLTNPMIPVWNFKHNQVERLKEFIGALFRTIEKKKSSLTKSSLTNLLSDGIHDRYLLMTSLGFLLPSTTQLPLPETDNESLLGAYIKHHVDILREASSVEFLQNKFDTLFGVDGGLAVESDDSEHEHELEGNAEVEAAKKKRQKYKNQKIRFHQIQKLLKSSKTPTHHINRSDVSSFYRDAWPAACVLVAPSVQSIYQRCNQLLSEFQDHPALLKVLELAHAIQQLPVFHTTTMSLVNALELLLDRCQGWEKFAHHGVSLKSDMVTLRQHIVLLRHQQLQDWRDLVIFRETNQMKEGHLWLADLVVMLQDVINEAGNETNAGNTLSKDTCQTIWSYLECNTLSKPIGQFESRLQAIQILSQLLQVTECSRTIEVGHVLGHFATYSKLTRPRIDMALLRHRKMMDKEVRNILKLATWDFTRHEALKESIHRAHFQLGKAIKKFDAFLQEPAIGYVVTPSTNEDTTTPQTLEKNILRRSIYNNKGKDENEDILVFVNTSSTLLSQRLLCSSLNKSGMLEWVKTLSQEIRLSLSSIDTTTSTHKRRLAIELKDRLIKQLQLQLLPRDPDMTFVKSPIGLFNISHINPFIFEDISTIENYFPFVEHTKEDYTPNAMSLSVIPSLWEFSQDTFYRLMRRCVQIQTSECHEDLLSDQSHRLWIEITSSLFEVAQKQRERVWNFGNQLCMMMDLISLLSSPSIELKISQIESLISSIELSIGAISQFTSFLGTSYEYSLLPENIQLSSSSSSYLHSLRSSSSQKTSESLLFDSLNEISFELQHLQYLLMNSPDIRCMMQKTSSINKVTRISFRVLELLETTVAKIFVSMTSSAHGNDFSSRLMSQVGIPLAVREHLNESLLVLTDQCNKLGTLKNRKIIQCQSSNILNCLNIVHNKIKNSNDRSLLISLDMKDNTNNNYNYPVLMDSPNLSDTVPIDEVIQIMNNELLKLPKEPSFYNCVDELSELYQLALELLIGGLDLTVGVCSLGLIISKITLVLLKWGYCRDKDQPEQEENEVGTKDDWQSGTGMGEGQGLNDISNEIEDENVMDGYKNEEKCENQNNDESNNEGMDVSFDVDGEAHKKEEELEDEENEIDEEDHYDREMGDVDLNNGGELEDKKKDEIEEDEQEEGEKHEQKDEKITTSGAKAEETDELRANDVDENKKTKEGQEQKDEKQTEKEGEFSENDDEEVENGSGEAAEGQEIEIDEGDEGKEKTEPIDMNEENWNIDDLESVASETDQQNDAREGNEIAEDDIEGDGERNNKDGLNAETEEVDETIREDEENNEMKSECDENPNNELEKDEDTNIDLKEDEGKSAESEENQETADDNKDNGTMNQQFKNPNENHLGITDVELKPNSSAEAEQQVENHQERNGLEDQCLSQQDNAMNYDPSSLSKQVNSEQQTKQKMEPQKPSAPNPIKENQEAIEQWLKRLSLLTSIEDSANEDQNEIDENEDVAQFNEFEKYETSRLEGLAEVENDGETHHEELEDKETDVKNKNHSLLEDKIEQENEEDIVHEKRKKERSEKRDRVGQSFDKNEESPAEVQDPYMNNVDVNALEQTLTKKEKVDGDTEMVGRGEVYPENEDTYTTEDNNREPRTVSKNELSDEQSKAIWAVYDSQTASTAALLCEQLRIILEPTLKGRLQGDYKTGKKLSMRKVVNFIASNFRKDRIWLRRSRPSQRDYRVVIALDNSQSMTECGVGQRALQAICLVCQAFQRLEIGQTGVCSFGGSQPEVVLPLRTNIFNDETGTKIIKSFTFTEQSERSHDKGLPDLFDLACEVFSSSAASSSQSSSSPVQQMLLIISDGRFNKSMARQQIHASIDRGIIPMLIIINNPQKSILDMKEAKFLDDKMIISKFLDDFPFPFYAVVDDVSSLPKVVADIIRQWIVYVNFQ